MNRETVFSLTLTSGGLVEPCLSNFPKAVTFQTLRMELEEIMAARI